MGALATENDLLLPVHEVLEERPLFQRVRHRPTQRGKATDPCPHSCPVVATSTAAEMWQRDAWSTFFSKDAQMRISGTSALSTMMDHTRLRRLAVGECLGFGRWFPAAQKTSRKRDK